MIERLFGVALLGCGCVVPASIGDLPAQDDDGSSQNDASTMTGGASGEGASAEGASAEGASEAGSDDAGPSGGQSEEEAGVCSSPYVAGMEPNAEASSIVDCDVGGGYVTESWRAVAEPAGPRLFVGGVYQTNSDHSEGNHPGGPGTVTWSLAGENVLVLSSYEPVDWTVQLAGAGELQKIVAIGYYEQTVTAPAGVVVETFSGEAGDGYATGHSLCIDPSDPALPEEVPLAEFAQSLTGLPLFGFDGCYDATTFVY